MQSHDDRWVTHFRSEGHSRAEPLASGMEGAVYRLEEGLVAKVWASRSRPELALLCEFYDQLAAQSLPFATPRILSLYEVDGNLVTHEVELEGKPLRDYLSETDSAAPEAAVECVVSVLRCLAGTSAVDAGGRLAVLGEDIRFRVKKAWKPSLLELLDRRLAEFEDQLRDAVPDFDSLYEDLTAAIEALPPRADVILHGDICGENILVDDQLQPCALLDWGFFSTIGDPSFDAAVAAGIFNMYGPHAAAIDRQVSAAIEAALAYEPSTLLVYRAAYAVATSNVYDPDGKDGHFAWCAANLRRSDLRRALAAAGQGA